MKKAATDLLAQPTTNLSVDVRNKKKSKLREKLGLDRFCKGAKVSMFTYQMSRNQKVVR